MKHPVSEKAYNELLRQEQLIHILKRRFWIMLVVWVLTVMSGLLVLHTGKIFPIEIKVQKLDFGSVYPNDFWDQTGE
jgi:hypothetical protein